MALWKTLTDWSRRKDHELAEKVESADPIGVAKLAISDSKKKVDTFTADIAKMVAHQRSVERDRDEALASAKKYAGYAKRAAEDGDENSVREAIAKRETAKTRADSYKKEIAQSVTTSAMLKKQLAGSRAEIATAENELGSLKARQTGAGIRKDMASARAKFDDGGDPLAKLRKLRDNVEASEDEAGALEEMANDADPPDTLAEKYGDAAAASPDLDDEVARMMASAKK